MNHQIDNLKIAFHPMGGKSWAFGPIYLKTLFHAVRKINDQAQFYLHVPSSDLEAMDYARMVVADGIVRYEPLGRWSPAWILNVAKRSLTSVDQVLQDSLTQQHINVLFTMSLATRYSALATVAWIPDFQHLHLPEMFTAQECLVRNKGFMRIAQWADRIILLSETVRVDFERFAPKYAHKVRVLRPITMVSPSVYTDNPDSILEKYKLPSRFVFLPNQFWKHKNHQLVIQALAILKEHGIYPIVVCSGKSIDYRDPTYFERLQEQVVQAKLQEQFVYIGSISHEEVLQLIRQSIAVLNPSLFEGWGASADEARSLGKPLLLSDISPHREQNPPHTQYFNPHDANELASCLAEIWKMGTQGPNIAMELQLQKELPDRLEEYGKSFLSIVQESIQSRN
jgi:glycosyltransferase involved in cell wall biosynthesis